MASATVFFKQFAKWGLVLVFFLLVVQCIELIFGATGVWSRLEFAEHALAAFPRTLVAILPVAALGAGASLSDRRDARRSSLASIGWWLGVMGCVAAGTGILTVVLAPGWGGALARLMGRIHTSDMSILSLSQLSAAYHAAALEAARTPSWTVIGWSKPWFMANMLGWEYYSRIADAVMVGLLAPLGFCIGVWTTHLAPRRRFVTRVAAGAALLFVLLVTMAISRELSLQKQLDPGTMAFVAVGEVCLILGVLAGPTAVWRLSANRA